MAEKIVSPGVFTNEIDQSFLPSAIADIGAVVVGPTVKGPAGIPTIVTSYSDFQAKFGDTFKSGSNYYQYLTSHTAEQYLKNSDTLTVVRILAGDYGGASVTVSASIDPAIVGGGSAHSASIRFSNPFSMSLASDPTGSNYITLTPYLGTTLNLHYTSSGAITGGLVTNSSTDIYFPSMSSLNLTISESARIFNASSSLHGLQISASFTSASTIIGGDDDEIPNSLDFTYNTNGAFGVPIGTDPAMLGTNEGPITPTYVYGGSAPTGYINITSSYGTDVVNQFTGSRFFTGGSDYNSGTPNISFKLYTHADGTVMNSVGPVGSNSLLTSGSKHNLRWEITSVNKKKGTFGLQLRRGDDTVKQKVVLESYSNLTLDPDSTNYIGKVIGDQVQVVRTDENGEPYLQLSGSFQNKSKYVRVEVQGVTSKYLDENGNVRIPAASASLPTFYSGSNSGSENGSFSGGTDGNVTHPIAEGLYENISENNSQGLDPSTNGGANGYDAYIQALNILSNQDDYDINLILTPGIISSIHSAVASKVIDVCEGRGDCFAIIDPVIHDKNVSDATTEAKTRNSNYAAVYWPWVKISDSQLGTQRWVPPSTVMGGIYAFNDKVAHPWFAPAGLTRGGIDIVSQAERKLTQADRDTLYDANVNPIATFPGQGVTVFGQKTLQKKASALDRINVRRLLIRVKKFIASSSRFLVFEQNTAATRRRFLGITNPFLEQVQAQSGLSAFRVVMDDTNNTPDTIDRNQLIGQLYLQPTRTAEFIVLDFTIQPTGASFPE